MIYLILLIYILLCVYYIDYKKYNRYRRILYWILCIIFIFISGFRYKIGVDTLSYSQDWNLFPTFWDESPLNVIDTFRNKNPEFERYRIGYLVYAILIKTIDPHFNLLLLSTATIFNIVVFQTIKKYSEYIFTTILIFYFNFKFLEFEFEIIREALATAIFLLFAYPNFVKKRWLRYYFGCFLGLLVHYSVLIMFIMPLIRNLRWSLFKYTMFVYLPSLIFGILGRAYLGTIIGLLLGGTGFVGDYIATRFGFDYNLNYILMYGFQPFVLYVFICFQWKNLKDSFYTPLLFYTIVFMNMSLIYYTAVRLISYIIIIDCIAFAPVIIKMVRRYKSFLIPIVFLMIYNIPTIYTFKTDPWNLARYYPYHSIFNPYQTKHQKELENDMFNRP